MKTAISIPDDVFEEAEKTARREGITRSRLYTRAVRSYIRKHGRQSIKDQLDAIYSNEVAKVDSVLDHLQLSIVTKEKW